MKIVLNDYPGSTTFSAALTELIQGASRLSVAVSYIQVSGWQHFSQHIRGLNVPEIRIVCTDQFAITPPAAVRLAQSSGVQIRNYSGRVTYHPKVFLAHDSAGRLKRFLVGSANLSYSAFTSSVEAGVIGNDVSGLQTLGAWFEELFGNRSAEYTAAYLDTMEGRWREAAGSRARARLHARRIAAPTPTILVPLTVEDFDTLDDVFATIRLPLGLLNMDYAGNNVRNVGRVRTVLSEWPAVVAGRGPARGKQRSELNLLGFAHGTLLTALGEAALRARSDEEVSVLWCRWLQNTSDAELSRINPKLPVAKAVFARFWRLREDVRQFFLRHAEAPTESERVVLKTIELLCNASDVVQDFTLEDIRTLVPVLARPDRLPEFIRDAVRDYQENKGTRSWAFPDRRILPNAWHTALAR